MREHLVVAQLYIALSTGQDFTVKRWSKFRIMITSPPSQAWQARSLEATPTFILWIKKG